MTPTVSLDPLPNAIPDAMSVSVIATAGPTLIVLLPCVGNLAMGVHVSPLSVDVLKRTSWACVRTTHSRPEESLSMLTLHAPPRNAGDAVLPVPAMARND